MAGRLLGGGWSVQVCDVNPARTRDMEDLGAHVFATPALAALQSMVCIVCVVDAAQTESVLFGAQGLAGAVRPGHAVILCPTISPHDVEEFARRLAERGIATIDAPMSGGPTRARDGTMSLMVACDDAVFEQQRDLLEMLSSKIFRISQRPGDGARTKLVNNLLAGINLAGAAEAMALAQRLGLRLDQTLDVIEQSSGQSWIGSDRMRRAIAADYEPRAHVSLLHKDTGLAVEAGAAAGFSGPLGPVAHEVFARAVAAGLAGLDDAALFKLLSSQ